MQIYFKLQDYVNHTRSGLQDLIEPYRYADQDIFDALNFVLMETERIRPDLFLDMKYQQPVRPGDTDDWSPPLYLISMNYSKIVPVPGKFFLNMIWYMIGYLQLYDVADTQDQRAQAFMAKYQQHMMTVNAA